MLGRLFPYTAHVWGTVADYSLRDLRKDCLHSKRCLSYPLRPAFAYPPLLILFRVKDAVQMCAKTAAENGKVESPSLESFEVMKPLRFALSPRSGFTIATLTMWSLCPPPPPPLDALEHSEAVLEQERRASVIIGEMSSAAYLGLTR